MAKGATVDADGEVVVTIALTTAGCPLRAQIQRDIRARVGSLPGVTEVDARVDRDDARTRSPPPWPRPAGTSRQRAADTDDRRPPPGSCMVASGKGGVGKSSVTVNLAAALAATRPARSACSTPTSGASRCPACSGVEGRLAGAKPRRAQDDGPQRAARSATGVLRVVSMGFLVEDEETALMWRGPHAQPRRAALPRRTSPGATTSTTCSSTCRPAPATCRWAWPACSNQWCFYDQLRFNAKVPIH